MPTTPSVAGSWRDRVFVLQGWPGGFCPTHVFTDTPCNPACVETRVAFAEAAYELKNYWLEIERRVEQVVS